MGGLLYCSGTQQLFYLFYLILIDIGNNISLELDSSPPARAVYHPRPWDYTHLPI